ncbi:P-II family nitrogen regulator [Enemella sp. A6]|uniref:P-II family nitrogen regulator n=1 Tax=Enemella sp. A6 TaxID=3440152 RepID=UPI003EBCF2B3
MKLVTAIIRPERVSVVQNALEEFGVNGLTISQAGGYGRQRGHRQVYRGVTYSSDLLPKVRLDVVADDMDAMQICRVVLDAARTGNPGDGKVWVTTVDEVFRVSDGTRGHEAV